MKELIIFLSISLVAAKASAISLPSDVQNDLQVSWACVEDNRPADGALTIVGYGMADDGYYFQIYQKVDPRGGDGTFSSLMNIDFGYDGVCRFSAKSGAIACSRTRRPGENINTWLKAEQVKTNGITPQGTEYFQEQLKFSISAQGLPQSLQHIDFLRTQCGQLQ